MTEMGPYDTSLQMFVEKPRTLNVDRLLMWRHIAENSNRLGRSPEGVPTGEIALALVIQTNEPIEKIMDRAIRRKVDNGKPADQL